MMQPLLFQVWAEHRISLMSILWWTPDPRHLQKQTWWIRKSQKKLNKLSVITKLKFIMRKSRINWRKKERYLWTNKTKNIQILNQKWRQMSMTVTKNRTPISTPINDFLWKKSMHSLMGIEKDFYINQTGLPIGHNTLVSQLMLIT